MRNLTRDDLASAGVWLASRAGVFLAAWFGAWVLTGQVGVFFGGPGELAPESNPLSIWDRWDVDWYRSIAVEGYGAAGHENNIAFPPGFPILLRGLHALGMDIVLAGLAISLVAGLAAVIALDRLARERGGRAPYATVAWVAAPMAVFLAAPYSETLFAAFAFWAWYLATRNTWVWAGVMAGFATLVRVNGLFLAVGLVVLLVTRYRSSWRRGLALALPFLAAGGFVVYLHALTGSWTAWTDAERLGWGREFGSPLDAARTTWEMATSNGVSASFAVQYWIELVAMPIIVVFVILLLVRRMWGEAVFVALTGVALATSTLFYSAPRSLLTLFPIWVILGVWMSRHRWVAITYVSISGPLMVVGTIAFTNARWVA